MPLTELLDRAEQAPKRTTDVQILFDATTVDRIQELQNQEAQLQADLENVEEDLADALAAVEHDLRNSDPRPGKIRKDSEKRTADLRAQLDAVQADLGAVRAQVAADLITFRFTALDGWEWQEITSRSIPREGVAEDAGRAYNLDEVCRVAAARTGVVVDDDDHVEQVSRDEWDRVWKIAPAPSLAAIKMAIWYLNEYQWDAAREAALNAARKASEAKAAGRTSPSPSVSGSRPAA